jgi:endonuclease V-like protein UPF0215 family
MSRADMEKLADDAQAQMKTLKQIGMAVRDKGKAAVGADPELARRCFTKLDELGGAVDQPESLKIAQIMGRALRKMAAEGLAKPGQ